MIKVKSKQMLMIREKDLRKLLGSEKARIVFALQECDNSRVRASAMLNIAIRSLYRKLRVYKIPYKNEN